nr:GNAT family N-acetyltransferase [Bacilli bacterium]
FGYSKKALAFLMERLLSKTNPLTFILGAQVQALGFYEKLGFKKVGDVYLDANIPHYQMILKRDK